METLEDLLRVVKRFSDAISNPKIENDEDIYYMDQEITTTNQKYLLKQLQEIANYMRSMDRWIESKASGCVGKQFWNVINDLSSFQYSNEVLDNDQTTLQQIVQLCENVYSIIWTWREKLIYYYAYNTTIQEFDTEYSHLDTILRSLSGISFHVALSTLAKTKNTNNFTDESIPIFEKLLETIRDVFLNVALLCEGLNWLLYLGSTTEEGSSRHCDHINGKLDELNKLYSSTGSTIIDLISISVYFLRKSSSVEDQLISHLFLSLHLDNIILLLSNMTHHDDEKLIDRLLNISALKLNVFNTIYDVNIMIKWICVCSLLSCVKYKMANVKDFSTVLRCKFIDIYSANKIGSCTSKRARSPLIKYVISHIEQTFHKRFWENTTIEHDSTFDYLDKLCFGGGQYNFRTLSTRKTIKSPDIFIMINLIVKTLCLRTIFRFFPNISDEFDLVKRFNVADEVVDILWECITLGSPLEAFNWNCTTTVEKTFIRLLNDHGGHKFASSLQQLMLMNGKRIDNDRAAFERVGDFIEFAHSALNLMFNDMNRNYFAKMRSLLALTCCNIGRQYYLSKQESSCSQESHQDPSPISIPNEAIYSTQISFLRKFFSSRFSNLRFLNLHRFFETLFLNKPINNESLSIQLYTIASNHQQEMELFLTRFAFLDHIEFNSKTGEFNLPSAIWKELSCPIAMKEKNLYQCYKMEMLVDVTIICKLF
ncbi:hypothetical protein FDP41_005989 [Naegleria fowleri]|uniref:Uncharacterized protein n=1 Tax=Naegleria fowleri TaxID=5763 RepID=A0A6A5BDU3_NAEFO|nr:uncharacterized protein FDP41_005989 [Naegleria fowleri]KAF0975237.1 hypothetical protein FDP41_005989 [Naegleria fowleri]